MKQWFFQFLQAVDPHFGWREGVHPGYNTDTFVIVVSGFKCSCYLFCRVDSPFVDYVYRQVPGFV